MIATSALLLLTRCVPQAELADDKEANSLFSLCSNFKKERYKRPALRSYLLSCIPPGSRAGNVLHTAFRKGRSQTEPEKTQLLCALDALHCSWPKAMKRPIKAGAQDSQPRSKSSSLVPSHEAPSSCLCQPHATVPGEHR